MFPIYILISSFFVFYSVNLVYNIFVPAKWIEQNSKYLAFESKKKFQMNHYKKKLLSTTMVML